jgi:hypothetical protein
MGVSYLAATFTTRETSSVVRGNTTSSGRALSTEPSNSYNSKSSFALSTFSGPSKESISRLIERITVARPEFTSSL